MTKTNFGMKITVWKLALFGGLLAFSLLLWLNDHAGYEAKSAILVNGHNDNQDDVVAKTVSAFVLTDTFTERTLGSTRLQESAVGMLSAEEQKSAVEQVKVRGGNKGGLVLVIVEHTDADVAEILSMEGTETLLRMSRLYIGDETEFTSVVIDKAIVSKSLVRPVLYTAKSVFTAWVLFAVILLLGPVWTWFVNHLRILTKSKKGGKESEIPKEVTQVTDQRFVPQKLDPTFLYPPTEAVPEFHAPLPKASEVVNSEVYGHTPEVAEGGSLQSVSVSMEDLPFTFETPEPSHSHEGSEAPASNDVVTSGWGREEMVPAPVFIEEVPAEKEPTVLEYKRRLNELLAQK